MADTIHKGEGQDHGPATIAVAPETPASPATAHTPPVTRAWWRNRTRLLLSGLVVLLLGAGIPYGWRLWHYYQTHESTDDASVVGDIVPISARVNGTVLSVHVDAYQRVEAGELLARLDPRDFALRVQQVESAVAVAAARLSHAELEVPLTQESTRSDTARTSAILRAAQSALREMQHRYEAGQVRLRTQEAAVAAAQANIDRWQARLDMARMAFKRMQQLMTDGVVAQQQFDEAESGQRAALAEWRASQQKLIQAQGEAERWRVDLRAQQQAVEQARARVGAAQALLTGTQVQQQHVGIKHAEVQVAQALWQQAQADLEYARQQLAYTTIQAPVAGVIAKKNLEAGQVVQAGRPLLAIVPAQPVWVEANFKETQLQHMRPGQKATIYVDAYPGQVFSGTVESLSPGTGSVFSLLPPENATGNFVKIVQRLPVKIMLHDVAQHALVLRPGMSVLAIVATQ